MYMSKKVTRVIIIILSVILALIVAAVLLMWRFTAPLSPSDPTPDNNEEQHDENDEIVEVTGIRIVLESYEMLVGTRFWPEVIIVPEKATDLEFELHSEDERILRFQGNNWVAVGAGRVNLVATASNGITGRVMITVLAPNLRSLSFERDEMTMSVGDTTVLNPILMPEDARLDEPISYTSSNENVITVTRDGRVNAVGAGRAIVRASSDGVSTEIRINVNIPVRNIYFNINRSIVNVGDQVEFTYNVDPPNATNADISIEFDGARIISTGTNSFRCEEPGEVIITATAENGRTSTQKIQVIDVNELADEVFRLTNVERTRAGLTQLGRTHPLNQIALIRARETINHFSHTRPDGRDFVTVYNDNNIEFIVAGENLASGQRTPAEVVQAWMDSQGHRENILNNEFGNMGVGVTLDSEGRIFWTQMFMN